MRIPGLTDIYLGDGLEATLNPDGTMTVEATGEGGGSQPVNFASASLSGAQIQALDVTPIVLASAPGAGKALVPLSAMLLVSVGGTPYSGGFIEVGSPADVAADLIGPFWGGYDDLTASGWHTQQISSFTSDASDRDNAPLVVGSPTGSAPADGDGTAIVVVLYTEVTL